MKRNTYMNSFHQMIHCPSRAVLLVTALTWVTTAAAQVLKVVCAFGDYWQWNGGTANWSSL